MLERAHQTGSFPTSQQ